MSHNLTRVPVLVAGLLVVASVVVGVPSANAVDQLFVSTEVEEDPASGCQADNAGSPGPDLRTATDALNDAWEAAAISAGDTTIEEGTLPPAGSTANLVTVTFPFASGSRSATVSAVDVTSPAPGSDDQGTSIVGDVTISTGSVLQDCSPKPAHIVDADGPHWTENIGSGSSRNGVLFTFDAPVRAFGAWFGDVETRPEAEGGTTAIVKLFDSDGEELLAADVDTSTADTNVCGGANSGDLPGCGNNTTRWIGFVRDAPDVASMLVIVGDDDTPTTGPAGGWDGLTEHLSWTGAQLALAPAELELSKTADVAEVDVGGSIEYTLEVTNVGDEPATGLVITDTPDTSLSVTPQDGGVLASGEITWNIATLAGGASTSVTYDATVTSFDQSGYLNAAAVNSDTTALVEDSVTVASRYADLSIAKSASNTPDAGDDLEYAITVTNAGVSAATGVTVTDTPDTAVVSAEGTGWTCALGPPVSCDLAGSLPAGETSATLVVTVSTSSGTDSVVTNEAEVTSDLPDPDESDNEVSVEVTIVAPTTTTTTAATTTSTSTTTTTTDPSASTSTTTSPTSSTTSTTGAGGVGGEELPTTGPTGPHPGIAIGLIGFGLALLLGTSTWRAWLDQNPERRRTR